MSKLIDRNLAKILIEKTPVLYPELKRIFIENIDKFSEEKLQTILGILKHHEQNLSQKLDKLLVKKNENEALERIEKGKEVEIFHLSEQQKAERDLLISLAKI